MRGLALIVVLTAAMAGCSTDQMARVVYSTFRVQNQAVEQSVPGQPRPEVMPFDRYQQERRGEPSR